MKYKLKVEAITDVGIKKNINEDDYIYRIAEVENYYAGVFAVADGVGGLEKGDYASTTASEEIDNWWNNEFKNNYNDYEFLIDTLKNVFLNVNDKLMNLYKTQNIKTATTLSLLFIYKNKYTIIHIGDSRIYKYKRFIKTKLSQLTKDQICIIEKNINGTIYKKSFLKDYLGVNDKCEYIIDYGEIKNKDIFFLCSDGVYKTIKDEEIKNVILKSENDLKSICKNLTEKAKQNLETDNITAISIKITK